MRRAGARRPSFTRARERSSASVSSRSLGCRRTISLRGRHAAQLDQHAREALRIRDRVAQLRPIGAAEVGADDERVALERRRRSSAGVGQSASATRQRERRAECVSWSGLFLEREGRLFEPVRQRERRGVPTGGRGGASRRLTTGAIGTPSRR